MLRLLFVILTLVASPAFALEAVELKTPLPTDHILGKDTAPVTIIEYASLSCHHCADFHAKVLPTLRKDYIDTGKVRLVFRDFPLNQPALVAAQFAHCAAKSGGTERYFEVVKSLFAQQADWAFSEDFRAKLLAMAKSYSLEEKALDTCMGDKELEVKILTSRQDAGEKLGVDATPFFLVNGEKTKNMISVEGMRKLLGDTLAGKSPEEAAKETATKLTSAQDTDMVIGKDSAKVTVVEYVNIACPHCGQFHSSLRELLQKDYLDTGKAKLVFREFPMNQTGFYAYMLAHCGGRDKFFDNITLLIAETESWASSMAFVTPLRAVAEKAGIGKDAYYGCLENRDAESRILKSLEGARELGLEHSPALYIDGAAVENPNDMAAIRRAVDAALAKEGGHE